MQSILRNAIVVDGNGGPRGRADVRLEGGRIAEIAEFSRGDTITPRPGAVEVDLEGLVLSPGFIDIHTHYDAQVLWDPDLTPSCWHGVTTVVIGNCGFGIAPTRPSDRDNIVRTLENVEGMSAAALTAGIDWSFETIPEYLDILDRTPLRLNVAALAGHTPIRRYVLGEDATRRTARVSEVEAMRLIVSEALDAGAIGFSTSRLPTHVGANGDPVPSRLASTDEIFTLASPLAKAGHGVLQVTPGDGLGFEEFGALSAETGRPLTWTALLTKKEYPGMATSLVDETTSHGGQVYPQVSCRPLVMQFTLVDPFPLEMLPCMKEVLERPAARRGAVYADPAWRERARPEINMMWDGRWGDMTVSESGTEHLGKTVAEVASASATDPVDVLLDTALSEDLATRFTAILTNDSEDEIAKLLADERTILGLSDAGAHASQLCDACSATDLLGRWVREKQVLSLEQAVWRLSRQPADLLGLHDRGRIEPGAVADLVAFDPKTVAPEPLERVWDLPSGADRLIARSRGIEHVWVAGEIIRASGDDVDVHTGRLLRSR